MFGRPILLCAGLLAAAIAAAWLRAETAPVQVGMPHLAAGRFYAVEPSVTGGFFDLAIDANSRYELIVSSLGDANRTHHVTLAAIPRTRVESVPVVRPVAEIGGVRKLAASLTSGDVSDGERVAQHQPEALARKPVSTSSLAHRVGVQQRRFFLYVTADALEDERGYVPVEGHLAGEGMCVRVYLDQSLRESDLAPGLVGEMIRLLDEEIIPRSRDLLGEHADVDHDGKLAVLVTPWLGKLCGGRTSLKGFVRANDFQDNIAAPFGNHADVVYLNSSLELGPSLKTLLAHEYTHAVCFSRRLADPAREMPLAPEEDWLNEAIAHVAENLHPASSTASDTNPKRERGKGVIPALRVGMAGDGKHDVGKTYLDWSNLDYRIAALLNSPQTSPLVVRDYYRAGLWRDAGCRGATYLFLRYCVDRFGEGLLRDLVDSPLVGRRNLERATGIPFAELFRRWTIALAEDQIASVRIHERVGGCDLAGPVRIAWDPTAGPCEIN